MCAGSVRSRAFLPHLPKIQALAEGEAVLGLLAVLADYSGARPAQVAVCESVCVQ